MPKARVYLLHMKRLLWRAVASGSVATIMVGLLALQHLPPASASAEAASTPISFIRLGVGTEGTLTQRVNYVLRSERELQTLWKMIGATTTMPAVDFGTQEVLAVFSDAGEKVSVASITDARDSKRRIVSVVIMRPEGTCAAKAGTSATYELVAVSAAPVLLTHEDIVATTSCAQ